jgi:hypothetical protein
MLQIAERVCVLSIDVEVPYDEVTFSIADCDLDRSEHSFPGFRAKVIFWFPAGHVETASAAAIENVIGLVLSEKAAKAVPIKTAPAGTDEAKPADGIAAGQTMEQVKGKLGEPSSVTQFGIKTVYVYPNLTVVFVDGKVSLIQEF